MLKERAAITRNASRLRVRGEVAHETLPERARISLLEIGSREKSDSMLEYVANLRGRKLEDKSAVVHARVYRVLLCTRENRLEVTRQEAS
jgi:hypothetical protein